MNVFERIIDAHMVLTGGIAPEEIAEPRIGTVEFLSLSENRLIILGLAQAASILDPADLFPFSYEKLDRVNYQFNRIPDISAIPNLMLTELEPELVSQAHQWCIDSRKRPFGRQLKELSTAASSLVQSRKLGEIAYRFSEAQFAN